MAIQYKVFPNLFRNLITRDAKTSSAWQLGFSSFRTCFGIYLFFYLLNFYFHFLVPTRKRNKRNSRRRFRSHENCIIHQSSLTTRDFVYFLMFQNHSNSSTLCFINILGSLRYCRFFSYVIFVIFYVSSFRIYFGISL